MTLVLDSQGRIKQGNSQLFIAPDKTAVFNGSLSVAADTTISGGGTLALGGFTATIPATGTVALLGEANEFTAAQRIAYANAALTIESTDTDNEGVLNLGGNRSGINMVVGGLYGRWADNLISYIQLVAGADATNKDEGYIVLGAVEPGGVLADYIRVGKEQYTQFVKRVQIDSPAINIVPFIVNGASGQTSDLQQWQVNGTVRFQVLAAGWLTLSGATHALFTIKPGSDASFSYLEFGDGSTYGWQFGKDTSAGTLGNPSGFYIYNRLTGNMPFAITVGDQVGMGGIPTQARLEVTAPNSTTIGLIVKSATSASVSTQTWQYGSVVAAVVNAYAAATTMGMFNRNFGNNVKGPTLVIGRNESAGTEGGAAGTLWMVAADGTPYYLWVDTSGKLRIHTAPPTGSSGSPTVADTAGTVVGTQA